MKKKQTVGGQDNQKLKNKLKERNKISIIIIARDESGMIGDCLRSVAWADEIIVVDTGSIDKTAQIAQSLGIRVIKLKFTGYDFSAWRNRGLKEAGGDWIFYLDADERVSPLLKEEILDLIVNRDFSAYDIPRRNFYLGKEMHFGGAWPDRVLRFFKKEDLIQWEGKLHEQPNFKGKMGQLESPLIHLSHRDLSSMMKKTIDWTQIEARLLFEDNHPPVAWWRIHRMMLTKFWERMIKQQSWRDGTEGWINAIFEVFNTFIIYTRLWELQNQT